MGSPPTPDGGRLANNLANNYDAIVAPKINFHEFNFDVSFSSRGKKNTNRIAQSYSLCAFIDCVRYAFLRAGKIVVSDKAVEAVLQKQYYSTTRELV